MYNKNITLLSTLIINAKSYKVDSIFYYAGLLKGVRKIILRPQNKIGTRLSCVVWSDGEINRFLEVD